MTAIVSTYLALVKSAIASMASSVRERGKSVNGKSIDYSYYDEVERWPHYFKKKNTKEHCKGKPGQEHVPVIELNRKYTFGKRECGYATWRKWYYICFHHEVCERCGKELRFTVDCPDR